MSVQQVNAYKVVCDWPGCEAVLEWYEFTLFANRGNVADALSESEWWEGRDGVHHYCDDSHPGQWASDVRNREEAALTVPHLLIHDGDTDNPDDDGKVTFVPGGAR